MKPILICLGKIDILKVRMKVSLFHLIQSWPLILMMKQSTTPWSANSLMISYSEACFSSAHLITPFDDLRVWWGVAFTGTPARSESPRSFSLNVLLVCFDQQRATSLCHWVRKFWSWKTYLWQMEKVLKGFNLQYATFASRLAQNSPNHME